jgi:D-amino peptidase
MAAYQGGFEMKTALLIADLEGIGGVDDPSMLVFGSPGYPDACAHMTREVRAAIIGLQEAGYTRIKLSDAHRAGSGEPNLSLAELPSGVELFYTDDMYGGPLLEGVDAVACVGMHAAGGTAGFGAHTVEIHTAWYAGERALSETDIALALAAERGIPALYSAGDDVLGQSLSGRLHFVCTKKSRGPATTESLELSRTAEAIRLAGRVSARPPEPPPPPRLLLRFKGSDFADAATEAGGRRISASTVEIEGARPPKEPGSRPTRASASAASPRATSGDAPRFRGPNATSSSTVSSKKPRSGS